jgi:hypothetical protein
MDLISVKGLEDMTEEAAKEEMAEARRELERYFGGEKQANLNLQNAKDVLKRFAKPDDLLFLEDTGLGNDPEFIKKLAELGEILNRARRKGR